MEKMGRLYWHIPNLDQWIINEAKKEFPYFTEDDKQTAKDNPKDDAVYNALEAKLNKRREKWFVKYFVDGPDYIEGVDDVDSED